MVGGDGFVVEGDALIGLDTGLDHVEVFLGLHAGEKCLAVAFLLHVFRGGIGDVVLAYDHNSLAQAGDLEAANLAVLHFIQVCFDLRGERGIDILPIHQLVGQLLIRGSNQRLEVLGRVLHGHLARVDLLGVALEQLAARGGFLLGHGGVLGGVGQLAVGLIGERGEDIVEIIEGLLEIRGQFLVADSLFAAFPIDGVEQLGVHHVRLAVGDLKGLLGNVLLDGLRDIAPRSRGVALGLGLLLVGQRHAERIELVAQIEVFLRVAHGLAADPLLGGLAVDLLIQQGDGAVHALLLLCRGDRGIEVVNVNADGKAFPVLVNAPALVGGGAGGRAEGGQNGEQQGCKLFLHLHFHDSTPKSKLKFCRKIRHWLSIIPFFLPFVQKRAGRNPPRNRLFPPRGSAGGP